MQKGDDPYQVLGVEYDADETTIKKAYRKAALKFHPDRQTTEEDKESAHDTFAKISGAYDILTDPVKRYDWKQANAAKMAGVPATPAPGPKKKATAPTCPQSAPARPTASTTWKPAAPKKQAPPPPPFDDDDDNANIRSKKSSTGGAAAAAASGSKKVDPPPFRRANSFSSDRFSAGPSPNLKRADNIPSSTRSYSFAPNSKENLRSPQTPSSSRIFADRQPTQPRRASSYAPYSTNNLREDLRPNSSTVQNASSRIFADKQPQSEQSSRRASTSSFVPSAASRSSRSTTPIQNRARSFSRDRSVATQPAASATVPSTMPAARRSRSMSRDAGPRSSSPRAGSTDGRKSNSKSPVSQRRTQDISQLPPPTKARSFMGLGGALAELSRDTRTTSKPVRRGRRSDVTSVVSSSRGEAPPLAAFLQQRRSKSLPRGSASGSLSGAASVSSRNTTGTRKSSKSAATTKTKKEKKEKERKDKEEKKAKKDKKKKKKEAKDDASCSAGTTVTTSTTPKRAKSAVMWFRRISDNPADDNATTTTSATTTTGKQLKKRRSEVASTTSSSPKPRRSKSVSGPPPNLVQSSSSQAPSRRFSLFKSKSTRSTSSAGSPTSVTDWNDCADTSYSYVASPKRGKRDQVFIDHRNPMEKRGRRPSRGTPA